MTAAEEFNKASTLIMDGQFEEAAGMLLSLAESEPMVTAFCKYRLAYISNATGEPLTAYRLYNEAFIEKPDLTKTLYDDDHSSHVYVFQGMKDEIETKECPLCGNRELQPKWCYPLTESSNYNNLFNPIRLWMYCEPCHHLIAGAFPEKLFIYNDNPRTPEPALFSYYSSVLDRISRYTSGMTLFEVGIGACECLLAAREIGFDATGIDVIDRHVKMAREKYGLTAQTADFIEYDSEDNTFDIIIMGDVIEHVSDPVAAMNKACDMLSDGGAIWISTPNFDSAYSITEGHDDTMKRQQYHINYFSRESFYSLLDMCGLMPVDYNISSHYAGSMEVIAVKI